jgi:hypothetical protein
MDSNSRKKTLNSINNFLKWNVNSRFQNNNSDLKYQIFYQIFLKI